MIGVTVLGSTGSIGISTLDVLARHPDRFQVIALTANKDVDGLFDQCKRFMPQFAVMADEASATRLSQRLRDAGIKIEVLSGVEGLEYVAALDSVVYVMAAIVGAAGLLPALAAARSGKKILLANKEALVVAGALFMREASLGGAEILPIDSEHNAVFQCMPANFNQGLDQVGVSQILLTASGGPFRQLTLDQLKGVTPDQACAHPNWDMGRKISVDSATMMNKGLEVIEACWLFDTEPDRVKVVLHPQSVIHSMVAYTDGSVLAQLGNPDMRTPIAHALAWPERITSGVKPLNLFEVARLDFEEPDFTRFACLRLAYEAIKTGGTAPAILNAANEVAVASFLEGGIAFTEISEVIDSVLDSLSSGQADELDQLLAVDLESRRLAEQIVQNRV
ncbi:MAG: 1-deoxy-D-xylulose-5-phosphate reductoisomerase [Sedimenticola sp.]|nr:1-deoxy-D-xylulose-5-phosphate reductoisomerase [Sedimenticola sp.]